MSEAKTITNNVPRFTIDAYELSASERAEFDYLDWPAIDAGSDSATFFRFRGQLYDLGEFMHTRGTPESSPLAAWHGYQSDTFFSAIVVRYSTDHESVVVGRIYT